MANTYTQLHHQVVFATHHRKKTFQEEYINMLTESEIDLDKRYIFKEPI